MNTTSVPNAWPCESCAQLGYLCTAGMTTCEQCEALDIQCTPFNMLLYICNIQRQVAGLEEQIMLLRRANITLVSTFHANFSALEDQIAQSPLRNAAKFSELEDQVAQYSEQNAANFSALEDQVGSDPRSKRNREESAYILELRKTYPWEIIADKFEERFGYRLATYTLKARVRNHDKTRIPRSPSNK